MKRDVSREIKRWITLLLAMLVIIACYSLFSKVTDIKLQNSEEMVLDDAWRLEINEAVQDGYCFSDGRFGMTNRGDKLILERTLPDKLMHHPVLVFRTVHSDIAVYLEGENIYAYGQKEYDAGKMVGYGYQYITLDEADAGKVIRIELRISENDAFSSLEAPCIYDGDFMQRDYLMRNRMKLACILFLIVAGILAIALLLLRPSHIIRYAPLFGIAMFSITIGVWSLCTTDLFRFFSYNVRLKNLLEYICLYLSPVFAFSYLGADVDKESVLRRRAYRIIHAILVLFVVIAIVLHATNLVHLPGVLLYCHITILLIIGYLIMTYALDMIRGRFKSQVLFMGMFFLVLFVFMDVFRYNFKKYTNITVNDSYSSLIYIGVLIFVLSLIYDFLSKLLKQEFRRIESETLQKMAYTDALTGLSNRRRCDEVLDDICSQNLAYYFIGFDLNNLKKVNDTQGHQAGDEYIAGFGSILKKAFLLAEDGSELDGVTVVRNGGDEFCVIICNQSETFVKNRLEKMQQLINAMNAAHDNWNMSTAYGLVYSEEPGADSAKQVMKMADDRMYSNKQKMKEKAFS